MLSVGTLSRHLRRVAGLELLADIAAAFQRIFAPHRFSIAAKSALLIEFGTGRVLYAQNADAVYPPASVTKLMTLRLTFQAIRAGRIQLTDKVPIYESASAENPVYQDASLMFLQEGDDVTVQQLMQGMAVPSASEAAVAMAEFLAGSVPSFVAMMNAEAMRLGMTKTRFVDPNGLSDENQTTARDLAVLARCYLQDVPEALPQLHTLKAFQYGSVTQEATNLLLGAYEGADGLKTGFLDTVGYNQISTAVRRGSRLIGIVIGTRSKRARRNQSAALLDYGFSHLAEEASKLGDRGSWQAEI
jgi:D-alanyl-D-alanine carboxypeptidase